MRKRPWLEALTPWQLAAAGAALFVLSAVITLAVLLAGGRASAGPAEQEPAPPSRAPAVEPAALRLQDFLFEEVRPAAQPEVYLFRRRQERWSEAQVQRHWVPPEELILEILVRENDRRIDRLLEEIP